MKIRNFTPHELNLYDDSNNILTIPSEGVVRVNPSQTLLEWMDIEHEGSTIRIPYTKTEYGEVVGLPEMVDGVLIAVSSIVRSVIERADLITPATFIRVEGGTIIGAKTITH